MEDFYYAGGLLALLAELPRNCSTSRRGTVSGGSLGEACAGAEVYDDVR